MDEVLGVLLAVIAGMMFLPQIENGIATERHTMTDVTTAQQQQTWVLAVSNYVKQNMTSLQGSVTTTPTLLNVATVKAANVGLPAGFSGTNPFNQTWTAAITQPSANNLQVLIYATGGTVIKDQELGAIARAAEGVGGFIPTNNSGVYSGGPATAYGSSGAWQISTAGYAVTGGSPSSLLNFNNGTLTSNFLYRNAVPGQPQLNTMSTDLGMGGNNINNAATVSAQQIAASGVTVANTTGAESVNLGSGSMVHYDGINQNYSQADNGTVIANHNGSGFAPVYSGNVNANGYVSASSDIDTQGTVNAAGNVNASGSVNAAGGMWTGGNVSATNVVTAQDVDAGRNVNAAGYVWANSSVMTNGNMTANDYWIGDIGRWASQVAAPWHCIQYDSYWASGILQNHYFSIFNSNSNVSYGSEGNGWMVNCVAS